MNSKKRLKKLARRIKEEDPSKFDMRSWANQTMRGGVVMAPVIEDDGSLALCKTSFCMAGHAIMEFGSTKDKIKLTSTLPFSSPALDRLSMSPIHLSSTEICDLAAKLLDIEKDIARKLFFTDQWPDEYQGMQDHRKAAIKLLKELRKGRDPWADAAVSVS